MIEHDSPSCDVTNIVDLRNNFLSHGRFSATSI